MIKSTKIICVLHTVASLRPSKNNYCYVQLWRNDQGVPVKAKPTTRQPRRVRFPAYLERIGYGKGKHSAQLIVQLRVFYRKNPKNQWTMAGNERSIWIQDTIDNFYLSCPYMIEALKASQVSAVPVPSFSPPRRRTRSQKRASAPTPELSSPPAALKLTVTSPSSPSQSAQAVLIQSSSPDIKSAAAARGKGGQRTKRGRSPGQALRRSSGTDSSGKSPAKTKRLKKTSKKIKAKGSRRTKRGRSPGRALRRSSGTDSSGKSPAKKKGPKNNSTKRKAKAQKKRKLVVRPHERRGGVNLAGLDERPGNLIGTLETLAFKLSQVSAIPQSKKGRQRDQLAELTESLADAEGNYLESGAAAAGLGTADKIAIVNMKFAGVKRAIQHRDSDREMRANAAAQHIVTRGKERLALKQAYEYMQPHLRKILMMPQAELNKVRLLPLLRQAFPAESIIGRRIYDLVDSSTERGASEELRDQKFFAVACIYLEIGCAINRLAGRELKQLNTLVFAAQGFPVSGYGGVMMRRTGRFCVWSMAVRVMDDLRTLFIPAARPEPVL
jgi:hypothetical protein